MRAPKVGYVAVAAIVSVLASTSLAVTWVVLGHDVDRERDVAAARVASIAAAEHVAVAYNSYDYTRIDQQLAAIEPEFAGSALDSFRSTRDTVKAGFAKDQIVSSARVVASGTEATGPSDGTVLIWLSVTTTAGGQRSVQQAPLRIHLVKQGSTWRADTITTVG